MTGRDPQSEMGWMMATVLDVVNQNNERVDQVTLDERIFGGTVNPYVLHATVVMQRAGRRQGTHQTKGRSDVSGGGKKPWKQKGTGRARAGSTRSLRPPRPHSDAPGRQRVAATLSQGKRP